MLWGCPEEFHTDSQNSKDLIDCPKDVIDLLKVVRDSLRNSLRNARGMPWGCHSDAMGDAMGNALGIHIILYDYNL